MLKARTVFASTALLLSFPLTAYAARIQSSEGCVNLRTEPSMNSEVIDCLEPGTHIEPIRIPPSGRFAWVKDEAERLWYKVSVPSIDTDGWVIVDYINLYAE